ncbi:MAG: hypothetical protein ABW166_11705 [Sedimenticola sp.]
MIVDDALMGTSESDDIVGTDLADILQGMSGDDTLTGGGGNDVLIGGEGADEFIYTGMDNGDDVNDFDPDVDTPNLDALIDELALTAGERSALVADESNWSGGADNVLKYSITEGPTEASITFDDLGLNDLEEVQDQIIADES